MTNMLTTVRAIYNNPDLNYKYVDKNITRIAAIKAKKDLLEAVYDYCIEERTIRDIADNFELSVDYIRQLVRNLESRGRVNTIAKLTKGYKCKFIIQKDNSDYTTI